VVELQTNFGGGKTHSMLALYHMAGARPVRICRGSTSFLSREGLTVPEQGQPRGAGGHLRGPQDVLKPKAGGKIRTTWGELAWQLGGAEGFAGRRERRQWGSRQARTCSKRSSSNARPLPDPDRRVGRLSCARSTRSRAAVGVVRLEPVLRPVADRGGEGQPGHAAGRLAARVADRGRRGGRARRRWRAQADLQPGRIVLAPGHQEESYEIVRRRLFKEIPGDKFHHRDNTLKQFAKLYRENPNDFPQGCADEDYRRKLEKAYPIHPELFDQLYTSWGRWRSSSAPAACCA
jgi:uncharacterized protein